MQISREDGLSDSSLVWLGAFTNMTCIAHKILGKLLLNYFELLFIASVALSKNLSRLSC